MHRARAKGQMAIAIALPGFNDLERSVAPIFLYIDHFVHQFSVFDEKLKKNLLQNMTKIVCLR